MEEKNWMTIEELAKKVNELLKETSKNSLQENTDKRYSNELSVRRIRDYLSKGLLDKPFKNGKTALFGQQHLNKLIALRELQSDGLSEQYIKKLQDTEPVVYMSSSQSFVNDVNDVNEINHFSSEDINMQNEALSLINSFNKSVPNVSLSGNALGTSLTSKGLVGAYYQQSESSKSTALNTISTTSKIWKEYQLDNEGKVFLKIENDYFPQEATQIIENLKNILNTK